jgi:tetratricopeptide (TPR) repeat protein
MALVNRSLLHRTPTRRYEVHELLRQYAEEKLDQEPAAGKAARDLHCAYYTAAVQQWEADLKGPRQQAALAEMDIEIENARASWDWAVEQSQVDRLNRAMEGLCLYYWRRSRNLEGGAACRTVASKLAAILHAPPVPRRPPSEPRGEAEGSADEASVAEGLRVWARALVWRAFFIKVLGRSERALARQLLQQSLVILERLELANQDIRAEKAFVLWEMPKVGLASGYDFHQARRMYEQSLALYRAVGDRWWTAKLLDHLCVVLIDGFCAHNEAKQLAEESLTIGRALGDLAIVAQSLVHLGYIAASLGQIEASERLFRESIPSYREVGARSDTAIGLSNVGCGLTFLAKFDEAHSLLEENLAILSDLGASSSVAYWTLWLGYAKAHLGQYEQARIRAQMSHTFFQEHGSQSGRIALSLYMLGFVALAEQAYAEAWQLLQESVAVFQRIKYWEIMGWGLSLLGYAPRGLGQLLQAERQFCEALRSSSEVGSFVHHLLVLPGIALLLADRGEVERAVELYGLASRYEFVANSRWFEDVAGRYIAEAAATLPPEVVAAAQERGRARDIDATVAELLAEFEERASQVADIHDGE